MLAEIYVNEQKYRRRVKGEKSMEYGCLKRSFLLVVFPMKPLKQNLQKLER
jgi:hypothetical protein